MVHDKASTILQRDIKQWGIGAKNMTFSFRNTFGIKTPTKEEQLKIKNAVDIYIAEIIKGEKAADTKIINEQADFLESYPDPQAIIEYLQVLVHTTTTDPKIRNVARELIVWAFTPDDGV